MKKKINLYFLLVAVLTIIITISLSTVIYYELFRKEVLSEMKTFADVLRETGEYDISNVEELRITVVRSDGMVAFDSNVDIGGMDNHGDRPEIEQAMAEGEGNSVRKSDTLAKSTFYYAVRLDNGDILRVAKEAGSIFSIFRSSFPFIGGIIVIMVVLCAVLAHLLTKSIVTPIEKMAGNLNNIESVKSYKEMVPFIQTIKKQHEDIMKSAEIRQEFTANVSHELKTPLTSISGYSELIVNGMAADKDVRRFAGEINSNARRLLTLINDIIRLSELDSEMAEEEFTEVNLYQIAENCVEMLRLNASKHKVDIRMEGSRTFLFANKGMMEELVYNLCDNAIRYNNENGSVLVRVYQEEGRAVLSVKDTGIGISKEHQERIFERFYRVDKSRSKSTGGTGLGLAIVKHIVARHPGSSIKIESEIGKGTEITVLFPVYEKC